MPPGFFSRLVHEAGFHRVTLALKRSSPERTKAEFQRLGMRVTMTPTVNENSRLYYQADVVNALPCLAGITEMHDFSATAVDRLHPQAIHSRTSKHWGFRVDVPANQLGPGWKKRA